MFIASALILGPLAMGSDVFAQGGKNTANQAINQANNAATAATMCCWYSLQAQHVTLLQTNPMQIQEATLLVKQLVAELELVHRW